LEYGKFKHHIQRECEFAGGKYLEAFFTSECMLDNAPKFEYAAMNVPYCIGEPCDSDESVKLDENHIFDTVHARYEREGYVCSIRYIRAVRFLNIYRRITDDPVPNPTFTPTMTPMPFGETVSSKQPISSAAQILPTSSTSNPAVTARNVEVFGAQRPALSVNEEPRNPWTALAVVLIVVVAIGVAHPLWGRLLLRLKPSEKAYDHDTRALSFDDISLEDVGMRAFDS
jgi:hypothetical protein